MRKNALLSVYDKSHLREICIWLPGIWLAVLAIVLITQLGRVLEFALDPAAGMSGSLIAFAWLIPAAATIALAPAWLLTLTLVRLRANQDGETRSMISIGASPLRLAKPYALATLLAMVPAALITGWVSPNALQQTQNWLTLSGAKTYISSMPDGTFREIDGHGLLYIESHRNEEVQGIFFANEDDKSFRFISAQRGKVGRYGMDLVTGTLMDHNETLWHFDSLHIPLTSPSADRDLFNQAMRMPGLASELYDNSEGHLEANRRWMTILLLPLFTLALRLTAGPRVRSLAVALVLCAAAITASYLLARLGHNLAVKNIVPFWVGSFLPLCLVPLFLAARQR